MQHLLQPRVLQKASLAAAVSTIASYPRLSLWLDRPGTTEFLACTIFVCSIVLWAFVFAWHTTYTGRPILVLKIEPKLLLAVTSVGVVTSVIFHVWFDPRLRVKFPQEYPSDLNHWLASVLFSLALTQLLLVFAPFDWLMRLIKNYRAAMVLTALWITSVQTMKIHSLTTPLPGWFVATLLLIRFLSGLLVVMCYLRGGMLLVFWWALLLESRNLLTFFGW